MTLDFRPGHESVTQADFTYSVTPDTISITDKGKGRLSVKDDIEAVLRKIEYWHQGSIAGFKIWYRDENGRAGWPKPFPSSKPYPPLLPALSFRSNYPE
jgi:hypothetical protein